MAEHELLTVASATNGKARSLRAERERERERVASAEDVVVETRMGSTWKLFSQKSLAVVTYQHKTLPGFCL